MDGTLILTALDNNGQWYISSAITEAID